MGRRTAGVISIAVVAAVLSPIVHERDSYPLSTYPMFSYPRDRIEAIDTAVGYNAAGRRERLSPTLIAGGIEVIHAAVTVSTAIANGDTPALCNEIAARIHNASSDLVRVEVVTETHDVITYFDGDQAPLAVVVHASCEVPQ